MTISYWLDAHKEKPTEEVDVAIIGGGIMGATAAYWLSRRGNIKTVLLEARSPGFGASARNGGFVLRGIVAYYNQAVKKYGREQARAIFQFNEQTHSYLHDFAQQHGPRFDYNRCGSYLLACSLEELHELEESATMMSEDGFEVDYLKHDPLDRNYYGALFNKCDAGVHPGKLVEALLSESGVPVYNGEQVFRLERLADESILVESTNKKVKCGRVLLLTNAFAPLLEPWLVGKLLPVRGQVIVTKPLKKRVLEHLCYANYGYEYFRQLSDDRFLIGGCREPFMAQEVGYADMVTAPVQTALQNYLKDRFPEVAAVPVDYRWSGVMAFTSDGLPLVGELVRQSPIAGSSPAPFPGVFYALGCNGHGMGWSFALTKLLVEMALDGASSGFLSADRLKPSQPAAK